ncbi:hypothetical protein Droror1_Dr00002377 [Drosera rotundifolia]
MRLRPQGGDGGGGAGSRQQAAGSGQRAAGREGKRSGDERWHVGYPTSLAARPQPSRFPASFAARQVELGKVERFDRPKERFDR